MRERQWSAGFFLLPFGHDMSCSAVLPSNNGLNPQKLWAKLNPSCSKTFLLGILVQWGKAGTHQNSEHLIYMSLFLLKRGVLVKGILWRQTSCLWIPGSPSACAGYRANNSNPSAPTSLFWHRTNNEILFRGPHYSICPKVNPQWTLNVTVKEPDKVLNQKGKTKHLLISTKHSAPVPTRARTMLLLVFAKSLVYVAHLKMQALPVGF